MLSILNQLLQKKLQNAVTNNVFVDKKVKTHQQQQNKKSNIKPLPVTGIEPGTYRSQSGCVTSAPPSQLRETIIVNLLNGFNANKAEFAGHTF